MELSQKQKEKIVEELNSESEEQSSGNTSLFTMANMEELKPFLQELTPMDMFDKSVALNQTTIANLADLLPRLSKKNLIRLFFATLKLPEKGANLKFGGKQQEQQLCEMAYANSQILGTTAIAQARLVKKKENELKEQESVEVTEDKGESK
jgi:hypothetical protein